MADFSNREKAECAEREVKQRGWVYPKRVANQKMTQALADRQIALMSAIAAEYRAKADEEEAKERLL